MTRVQLTNLFVAAGRSWNGKNSTCDGGRGPLTG